MQPVRINVDLAVEDLSDAEATIWPRWWIMA